MKEIVTYVRVSTEGQHKSGLGKDAQQRALTEFAGQHGLRMAAAYSDTAKPRCALDQEAGARCGHPRRPQAQVPGGCGPVSIGCRVTCTSSRG